jgi:uncharacterized membrane protein YhaH (DUF805 family)
MSIPNYPQYPNQHPSPQGQFPGQPYQMLPPPQWSIGNLLFSFRGRINRAKWWLAVLVVFIISIATGVLFTIVEVAAGRAGQTVSLGGNIAVTVLTLWISLATAVKRFHDMDRTGHWNWLFYLGPLVIVGIAVAASLPILWPLFEKFAQDNAAKPSDAEIMRAIAGVTPLLLALLVCFAIWIWEVIWLGAIRGTRGPNRYGNDPIPHIP